MLCECGITLQGSPKFCPECGRKVSVPATANIQSIPCPNTIQEGRRTSKTCGTLIKDSQKFCTECGWEIEPKAFLPEAFMCHGVLRNGKCCENIVTPNNKFCSECGTPPSKFTLSQVENKTTPAVVEKTIIEDSASGDHGERPVQDMDFELLDSASSDQGLTRQESNEKATHLENSSDFCNGFTDTSGGPGSSYQGSSSQSIEEGSNEIGDTPDSMEVVERPVDGQTECLPDDNRTHQNENKENPNDRLQREPLSENEVKSEVLKEGEQEPDRMQGENKESLAEKSVYEPTWTMQEDTDINDSESDEQKMLEKMKALEMRKRKSPERDIPDVDPGKKMLLSTSIAGENEDKEGDLNKGDRTSLDEKMEGSVEKGQNDDDDDENDDDENDIDDDEEEEEEEQVDEVEKRDGTTSTKPKRKRPNNRKKKKHDYQKKKGQLPATLCAQGKSSSSSSWEIVKDKPKPDKMEIENVDRSQGQSQKKDEKTNKSSTSSISHERDGKTKEDNSRTDIIEVDNGSNRDKQKEDNAEGRPIKERDEKTDRLSTSNTDQDKNGKLKKDYPKADAMEVDDNTKKTKENLGSFQGQQQNKSQMQETDKPSTSNADHEKNDNGNEKNTSKDKGRENSVKGKVQLLKDKLENPLKDTEEKQKSADDSKKETESSPDPNKTNEKDADKNKDHPTYAKVASRSGVNTRSSQFIEVHFHVIVSYNCVRDANHDQVYLRFLQSELGGWESLLDTNQVHPKKHLERYGILYEGTIQIPKKIVHLNFYYNYCIVPGGVDRNAFNEYFHKEKKRVLKIPDKKDVWHRYDGVVLPVPGQNYVHLTVPVFGYEWFDNKGYEEDVAKMLNYAVKIFFPRWKGYFPTSPNFSSLSAEEAKNTIEMIWLGFWTNYGNMMKKWNRQPQKFRSELGEAFFELLRPALQEITNGNTRLPVSALGILYLVENFDLNINNLEYTALFKSLVLDASKKEESLAIYKEIMESFSLEFLKELLEGLIQTFKNSSNPIWLCCIPWWQFVTKKVKPFERVQLSAKHDQSKPVWWGIEDYEVDRVVSNLKKVGWKNVREIFTTLLPMFPMDYFLPRTLMAGLRFEQFIDVFECCEIPPEITIASTVYFVKLTRDVENKREVAKRCFENILQEIKKRHVETENITEDDLHHAWITYHIAADFVTAALSTASFQREICLNSIKIFALAVSSYDNMIHRRKLGEKEKTQHRNLDAPLGVLSKQRESIRRWLKSLPFYGETKAYLKAWNVVLSMEMKDGTIKTAFMADIKDAFKEDIDSRDRGLEKLVDIYCSDVHEFSLPMQEALSDAALEALKKGCHLDDSILQSKGVERYGGLLTKLFEITWKTTLSKGKQSLLEFTLTWPSFRHFLDMFYQQEKRSKLLTRESGGLLTNAANQVWKTFEELQTGQITVKNFHLLQENYENFSRIIRLMAERDKKKSATSQENLIHLLMKIREKEIVHFEKTRNDIGIFVGACIHFPGKNSSRDYINN